MGGWSDQSLAWMASHGVCTGASYPHTNDWNTTAAACIPECKALSMPYSSVASVAGEHELEAAIALQPVAVDISATSPVFKNYESGIITGGCNVDFNHVVLGVGYGVAEVPYFKMKNSWGDWWGEGGFVRLQRGVGGVGTCGLARHAAYPVVFPMPFNLVTFRGVVISEYYSNLFASAKQGSVNELWTYDAITRHITVGSNHQCLDAYPTGSSYAVHTYSCDAKNDNQKWVIDSANHAIKHAVHPTLCLDVDPNQNNKVQVWSCSPGNQNQWVAVSEERVKLWNVNGNFLASDGNLIQFYSPSSPSYEWAVSNLDHTWRARSNVGAPDLCLDAYEPWNGGAVHLYTCDSTNGNQKWIYDAKTQQLRHLTHVGFCLDMRTALGDKAHLWTCNTPANSLQKFQYKSLTFPA
ncbi:cysteine proteinase EP-B 2-like [Achlya hypogyna]|nr:cysteine proteinase EP-B 2-like [Achlya hypogyna]